MARKGPRRVGAPLSLTFEAELRRALRPMIQQVRATLPKIKTEADAKAMRAALRRAWSDKRIAGIIRRLGARVEVASSLPWQPLLTRTDAKKKRARVPFDGAKLLNAWSREAVGRITSVRDEVAEGLRRDVVAAVEAGTDVEVLQQRWIAKGVPVEFGTLEGRMKVIAQNQIGILHAQIQSERARAFGVEDFIWRTQGDDKVRDAHIELADTRHSYTNPPSEGLPGQPVNCRCWAESVIPDALVEELEIGAIFER